MAEAFLRKGDRKKTPMIIIVKKKQSNNNILIKTLIRGDLVMRYQKVNVLGIHKNK